MIEPKQTRGLPQWASALAILACLGGGGAFAWWVAQGGTGDRIIVLDRAPGDGVKKFGRDQWRVTAGYAVVQVTAPGGGGGIGEGSGGPGEPTFEFYFDKYDFLTPEQVEILATARRLVNDPVMAAAVGLSPAQMSELRDVRKQAKVQMSPEDDRRLAAAWPRYAAAATDEQRRAPEGELVRIVEQISERLVGPVRQSAVERAGRVKSIVTPEQWQQLDGMAQ
jgi:hypothetical protein